MAILGVTIRWQQQSDPFCFLGPGVEHSLWLGTHLPRFESEMPPTGSCFEILVIFRHVYMCVCVWVCTLACGTHRSQKRGSDPLVLELRKAHEKVDVGNWTKVLCKNSTCFQLLRPSCHLQAHVLGLQ